jgi:BASS family bile acid:Na+ symporter
MDAIATLLPVLIQASLLLVVFALGLGATIHDATYLLRQPAQLLRAAVAMNVAVPLFAALLAALFPLTPVVKLGLVLMAVSPVPPFLPGKQLRSGGRPSYVFGLLVAASLLAIVIVPLTMALLRAAFPVDVRVSAGAVAKVVLATVLVPLGLGIAVRRLRARFAERNAPIVERAGYVLLLVGLLPILVAAWPSMWAMIGNGTVLAIAAVAGFGLLAGHLLGGPEPDDRTALALASASRHPAVALLIGNLNFPGQHVGAVVLLYLLVALLVSAPYGAWRTRTATARLVA